MIVDAADLGARPGTVALLEKDQVRATLLTTHSLPLSVIMEFLEKDTGAQTLLVGIQPDLNAQGFAPAGAEQAGLTRLLVSVYHIFGEPRARIAKDVRKMRRHSRAV